MEGVHVVRGRVMGSGIKVPQWALGAMPR